MRCFRQARSANRNDRRVRNCQRVDGDGDSTVRPQISGLTSSAAYEPYRFADQVNDARGSRHIPWRSLGFGYCAARIPRRGHDSGAGAGAPSRLPGCTGFYQLHSGRPYHLDRDP
jgi:hypothetical protein